VILSSQLARPIDCEKRNTYNKKRGFFDSSNNFYQGVYMMKFLLLSVLLTGHLFAQTILVQDVDMLVKCEDGKDAKSAARDINSSIVRGEFYDAINGDTPYQQPPMIRVKAPFSVSAPAYVPASGNKTIPRLCVTVTKQK